MKCRLCLGLTGERLGTEVIEVTHAYLPGRYHTTNDGQSCLSQRPRPARPESAGTPGKRDLRPARFRLALEAVVSTFARELLALDEHQGRRTGVP